MGGKIEIKSLKNVGTKITFSIKNQGRERTGSNNSENIRPVECEERKSSLDLRENGIFANVIYRDSNPLTLHDIHIHHEEQKSELLIPMITSSIPESPLLKKKQILIVDDNAFNLFALKQLLKQFHIQTKEVILNITFIIFNYLGSKWTRGY